MKAWYGTNFDLIALTVTFFVQRLWFFWWEATRWSDAHSLRSRVASCSFYVFKKSLSLGMLMLLGRSFEGLHFATPLVTCDRFYQA